MYFNDWQLSCFYWTFPNVSSYSSSHLYGNVLFGNLFCLIISNTSTLLQYLTTLHSITSSTIMLLLLLLPRKRSTIFNNIAFLHLFRNIAAVTVPPIEMQAALHSAIFDDIAFHCPLYCCSFCSSFPKTSQQHEREQKDKERENSSTGAPYHLKWNHQRRTSARDDGNDEQEKDDHDDDSESSESRRSSTLLHSSHNDEGVEVRNEDGLNESDHNTDFSSSSFSSALVWVIWMNTAMMIAKMETKSHKKRFCSFYKWLP